MMLMHTGLITAMSLVAVWIYYRRLQRVHWRTHGWPPVVAQVACALLSCAVLYAAAAGASPGLLYPGAIAVWGHIAASATRWHGSTTNRGTTVADRAREISTTIDAAAIRTPAPPDAS